MPTFEPLIPSSVWLALVVAGAGLLAWYARRRPAAVVSGRRWAGAVGLMALSIAAVLVVLLNPTWAQRVPPPAGKPGLTVLVDATASMATPDGPGGAARFVAAAATAGVAAERLAKEFDVRLIAFADAPTVADAKSLAGRAPAGATTDLAAALAGGLDQERPAGQAVLLLSDGIHNGPGGAARVLEAARLAKSLGAPVYTRTYGGGQTARDLAADVRSPQDFAFIKQKIPLTVRVVHQAAAGAKTDVTLWHDGKEIGRKQVELSIAGPADVHFMIAQDKAGLYSYEVRVAPLPGEVSQANNAASYLLRVVDEPIRVLLLEGKPYWDSKFLVRTLSADPSVALDSVVKMAEGRLIRRTMSHAGATPAAPAPGAPPARSETWQVITDAADVLGSADRLRGYQVVVLGRDAEVFLTEAAVGHLQNWIAQDGGSLVCYRGSPTAQVNQGLAKLLPVKWTPTRESRVRVKLTEPGRDLQWMGGAAEEAFARLPALATASQVQPDKPLSVVLATGAAGGSGDSPAVVYQPYGAGRVVAIEGAGMWRWAFSPPDEQSADDAYSSLWHSVLRWLISGANLLPGQKLTLRTDKVSFTTTEDATLSVFSREEESGAKMPEVELIAGESEVRGRARPAPVGEEPGSYRVSFGKLPVGRYQARLAGADTGADLRTVFDVRSFGDEQLNLAARPDLMKRIADDTGGAVLADDAAVEQIGKQFENYVQKNRPAAVRRTTAWDRWWVLALVIGLWGATWALRRNSGLI